MTKLERYFSWQVLRATLLVLLLLFGINFFMQLITQVNDIGTGSYGVAQALLFVLMQMPQNIYQYFPIAALIGCLMGLGQLASKNELIAAQAAGMSIARITLAVLKYAVFLVVFMVFLGEFVAPKIMPHADLSRSLWLKKAPASTTAGAWLTKNNSFLHFDYQLANKNLVGVMLFRFKGNDLQYSEYAPKAVMLDDQHWVMENAKRTVFLANGTHVYNIADEKIEYKIDTAALEKNISNLNETNLVQLQQQIKYLKSVGLSTSRLQYSFWQRILNPVIAILMICIAAPFVFGSMRNSSMSVRIIVGLVFGFSFFVLNQVIGTIALALQVPPFLSAALPVSLFALIYLQQLKKI